MSEGTPDLTASTLKAKGRRPYFFDDPVNDKLLAMLMAVAGELAVTRERLDTVERILAQKGQLTPAEVDAYRPDEQAKAERGQMRQEYIARVMRILQNELDELEQMKADENYRRIVEELGSGKL